MHNLQADRFHNIVNALYRIGPRNLKHYQNLTRAQVFLEMSLRRVCSRTYLHEYHARGRVFHNVIAEKTGTKRPEEILIIGAHYDSHKNSPGCSDNGSSLAVLLQLAQDIATMDTDITVRFICFVNEEAPFTHTKYMGSRVYAQECRKKNENIVGTINLDSLGSFNEKPHGQRFSLRGRILPERGDFLAIVSNPSSEALMQAVSKSLSRHLKVSSKVVPGFMRGGNSSDHWSFWKEGFPAVLITDTAGLRSPFYHTPEDTPEKINYDWLVRIYEGLLETVTIMTRIPDLLHVSDATP